MQIHVHLLVAPPLLSSPSAGCVSDAQQQRRTFTGWGGSVVRPETPLAQTHTNLALVGGGADDLLASPWQPEGGRSIQLRALTFILSSAEDFWAGGAWTTCLAACRRSRMRQKVKKKRLFDVIRGGELGAFLSTDKNSCIWKPHKPPPEHLSKKTQQRNNQPF